VVWFVGGFDERCESGTDEYGDEQAGLECTAISTMTSRGRDRLTGWQSWTDKTWHFQPTTGQLSAACSNPSSRRTDHCQ